MTEQIDWVTSLPAPRAHRHDPASSHEAARDAKRFQARHCELVLAAVRNFPLSTSAELAPYVPGLDLTEVRRRLTDLKTAGHVHQINSTVPCSVSGKRVSRWEAA